MILLFTKNKALLVVGAIVLATIGFWAFLNQNAFLGTTSTQLLLYGRLAGIVAAFAFMFQLLSMGRNRLIDKGSEKTLLLKMHRYMLPCICSLIAVHVGLIIAGRMILYRESFFKVLVDTSLQVWVTIAILGVVLYCVLAFIAMGFLLKKINFQSFKKWHKWMYAVVLLTFCHQIIVGFDCVKSTTFMILWIILFALTFLDVIIWKLRKN